jgi:hypothetical protein
LHLPRDAGTWALIISIIGLLLIFPLGILVNIVTPKLQDWWAARSVKALMSRIEKLTNKLFEIEANPPLNEFEDQMVTEFMFLKVFLRIMGLASCYAVIFIFMFLLTHTPANPPPPHRLGPALFTLVSFIMFTFLTIIGLLITRPRELDGLYRRRSPAHRKQLKAQIVRLVIKLNKYQDARS